MENSESSKYLDTTEQLQQVQSLSISDVGSEDDEHETRSQMSCVGMDKIGPNSGEVCTKTLHSHNRNRCYRKESSFSDEESSDVNTATVHDEGIPGASRPRSRSVEGKRPADREDTIPTSLPKYPRQHDVDPGGGEPVRSSTALEAGIFSANHQLDDSVSSIESAGVEHPEPETEESHHGSEHGGDGLHLESSDSDDSSNLFFENIHDSSSSSQESLQDLDHGKDVRTNSGNAEGGTNTEIDSRKSKILPDLLPSPLSKSKPKETWNFPKAIIAREIGSGKNYGRKQSQAEQHFCSAFYGSLYSAERLELMWKLEGHTGCVNCLNFNQTGTKLVSGSDDLDIKIWNHVLGKCITSFHSGHRANVFQAKFIPFLGMDTMIVSSARDNQVRLNELSSSGEVLSSKKLAQHKGACHKLSICPDNPHVILSCGEDSCVFSIDIREDKPNRILNVKEDGKKVSLYSLHQNPSQPHEFCVSGKDSYVRIFDIRKLPSVSSPVNQAAGGMDGGDSRRTAFPPVKKFCPHHLVRGEGSDHFTKTNVTSVVYNYNGTEILASYNDEHIYLFDASHSDGADFIKKYEGHRNSMTVKGVNFFGDKSQFIVSGSDCGHIFVWEKNTESIVNFFQGDSKGVVNCLEGHPTLPILATSGLDDDVKIWIPINKTAPEMTDLLTTIKRNKRKRENASTAHSVSDGFIMWALRHQMRAVRSVRRNRRHHSEDETDSMEDSDWEDNDDDEEDEPGGMDCIVA